MVRKITKDRTRKYGGVVFKESLGNLSRRDANRIAKEWRNKGRNARVLKGKWPMTHRWSVFLAAR